MGRVIKFRAWDKSTKNMLLPHDPNKWVMYCSGSSAIDGVWCTEDLGLMQFTGLKDKNGIEIYEGDIVQHIDPLDNEVERQGVVFFNTNNYPTLPAFHLCDKYGESLDYHYGVSPVHDYLDSIVIGNIYENPELLEGE